MGTATAIPGLVVNGKKPRTQPSAPPARVVVRVDQGTSTELDEQAKVDEAADLTVDEVRWVVHMYFVAYSRVGFVLSIDWLMDLDVDVYILRSIDWLIDWLGRVSFAYWFDWLIVRFWGFFFFDWLIDQSIDYLSIEWLIDWLIDWFGSFTIIW